MTIRIRDSLGRIVSMPFDDRLKEQLENVTKTDSGCWLWNGAKAGRGGYPVIRDENNISTRVSKIMLERAGKLRPTAKHLGCHTCDTPACVNTDHLFWGTTKDNAVDASQKGRLQKPKSIIMRQRLSATLTGKSKPHMLGENNPMNQPGVRQRQKQGAKCAWTPDRRAAQAIRMRGNTRGVVKGDMS